MVIDITSNVWKGSWFCCVCYRTTASTNMNDVSSRSHAIFTIVFTQVMSPDQLNYTHYWKILFVLQDFNFQLICKLETSWIQNLVKIFVDRNVWMHLNFIHKNKTDKIRWKLEICKIKCLQKSFTVSLININKDLTSFIILDKEQPLYKGTLYMVVSILVVLTVE